MKGARSQGFQGSSVFEFTVLPLDPSAPRILEPSNHPAYGIVVYSEARIEFSRATVYHV